MVIHKSSIIEPVIVAPRLLHITRSSPSILLHPIQTLKISQKPLNIRRTSLNILETTLLNNKIIKAKEVLLSSKKLLAQYSVIDNSVSKKAACEAVFLAEREVEEACKNWCYAKR